MLCAQCQQMFQGVRQLGRDHEYKHHNTASTFLKSVESDCQICVKLWDKIPQPSRGSLESRDKKHDSSPTQFPTPFSFFIVLEEAGWLGGYRLVFNSSNTPDPKAMEYQPELCLYAYPIHKCRDFVNLEPQSDFTDSVAGWKLAMRWLDTCIRDHNRCNLKSATGWHPTRLLDLKNADKGFVQLVTKYKNTIEGRYITLSHCWGGLVPVTLTSHNVDSLSNQLLVNGLPQLFQDAVSIVRRLGIRYLWIDALCILQDSESDWRTESSQMGDVYRNSFCNLCATDALNSSGSFWFKRKPRLVGPISVTATWEGPATGVYHLTDEKYWHKLFSENRVSRRAWVLQERLLAPRVLHFGRSQLAWECFELDACEIYPFGPLQMLRYPHGGLSGRHIRLKSADVEDEEARLESDWNFDGPHKFEEWSKVVGFYSNAALTFERDKLVAISGVASRAQKVLNCQYLAGLWKSHMPAALLWKRAPGSRPIDRPKTYRAPSWSWASIDGPVIYERWSGDSLSREWVVNMIDCKIENSSSDLFGMVADASLLLRGRLIGPQSMLDLLQRVIHTEDYYFQTNAAGVFECDWIMWDELRDWKEARRSIENLGGKIYCLPIRSMANKDGAPFLKGIILQLNTSAVPRERYRRLAMFQVSGSQQTAIIEDSNQSTREVEII